MDYSVIFLCIISIILMYIASKVSDIFNILNKYRPKQKENFAISKLLQEEKELDNKIQHWLGEINQLNKIDDGIVKPTSKTIEQPLDIPKKRKGYAKCTDRETYPYVFTRMDKLLTQCLKLMDKKELAKLMGTTTANIYVIQRWDIQTKDKAKQYTKTFQKIIKNYFADELSDDEPIERFELSKEPKEKAESESMKKTIDKINKDREGLKATNFKSLATPEQIHYLQDLTNKVLEHMTQIELWLRLEVPQSAVSYILNKKLIEKNVIENYTTKMEKILARLSL